ncbi:hypothetical protein ABZ626_36240 [Streptomyces longispororuber]|uniref:hypothetical protein n=1 Tax=Streptomyces TaxID=1883 RepID=UPI0024A8FBC4|nr:hypothetical protein [Streptomyces sp. CC224B]
MSPDALPQAAARPAAVVNEDIRALWYDPRVGLTDDRRAAYERLLTEWAAAVRADVVTAA